MLKDLFTTPPKERTLLKNEPFDIKIAPDGTPTIQDKPLHYELGIEADREGIEPPRAKSRNPALEDQTKSELNLGFKFGPDLNDTILRSLGQDPYRYEKQKQLDQTRDARVRMAQEACKKRLAQAIAQTPKRLRAIWQDPRLSPAQKRTSIFQMWDECAEEGDPQMLRASRMIRQAILGFIRKHLPQRSKFAYSDEELRRLNARRRSRAEFAPYEKTGT